MAKKQAVATVVEPNKEVIEAENFAKKVLSRISGGVIEIMINAELSIKSLPIIKKQNPNIVLIHAGELQYFIDKTNSHMKDELNRIMTYKRNEASKNIAEAESALEQLKKL